MNYPSLHIWTLDLDTQFLVITYLDYTVFLAEHLLLRHVWSRPMSTGSRYLGIMEIDLVMRVDVRISSPSLMYFL